MNFGNIEFRVDAVKLGAGLLAMFDEDDAGPLAFGMLPAEKMRVFEAGLLDKFNEECRKKYGGTPEELAEIEAELFHDFPNVREQIGETVADELKRERRRFASEVGHLVAVEIYRQASAAGRMIV